MTIRDTNLFQSISKKWSNFKEQSPKAAKGLQITGIALAVLAVLGVALLAYMHFSGLGINAHGFQQLAHKALALINAPSGLNIGKVAAVAAVSAGGTAGLIGIGSGIKKYHDSKTQNQPPINDE
ncbi:MAG: hypothetical protein JJU12_05020 [Chlamydiales bacterium]|nr:hypothetical protein [Chlamydiales bacterium]